MKVTMPRSCPTYRQAGRAVRSAGLVTASARGAARVTWNAPRSLQGAARSSDSHVAANNGPTIFADASLIECAAAMIATIPKPTAPLAKTTHMARHTGFEECEEWLVPRPRVAASAAYIEVARPGRARDGWRMAGILAKRTVLPGRDSAHPTQDRRDTTLTE